MVEQRCQLAVDVAARTGRADTGGASRVKCYARRHDISEEAARQCLLVSAERKISLPFVQVNSRSSGQRFALFIEHGGPWTSLQLDDSTIMG
ncbi:MULTISPECIES: type I-F CRISPR-associated endoribonuclease Cas6/Csy4 [Chromohalobacter]|uniref:type I-F CRISPR-associated endoribonuclease Cas6/Csy4 n=1 Tax=Chromohalobacter TaxID=42054 RepID=UPI001FFCCB59